MKCVRCGSEMSESDRACVKCGAINYLNPLNDSYVRKYGDKKERTAAGYGYKIKFRRFSILPRLIILAIIVLIISLIVIFVL